MGPPPPYVDHQTAKKVRNDVNVHKDTLRILVDEQNPDHVLISFVFDAMFDGRLVSSLSFFFLLLSIVLFFYESWVLDCFVVGF